MCLPLVVGAVAGYAATAAAVSAGVVVAGGIGATLVGVAVGAIAGGMTAKLQGDEFADGAKMGALGGLGGALYHGATYVAAPSTTQGGLLATETIPTGTAPIIDGQVMSAAPTTFTSAGSTGSTSIGSGSVMQVGPTNAAAAQGFLANPAASTGVGSGTVMQAGPTKAAGEQLAGQGVFGKASEFLQNNQILASSTVQLAGYAMQSYGEGAAADKAAEDEEEAKAERRLAMSQSASGRVDRLRSRKRRQAGTGSDVINTPPPAVINKQYDEVVTA